MLNKCKMRQVFSALVLFSPALLAPLPAHAGDKPFHTFPSEPATLSLPAQRQLKEGTWQVALALDLAPGWKTYWRAPGPFGVPPRLSLESGENVASHKLRLPEPHLVKDPNGDFVGYKSGVDFLIEIAPDDEEGPVLAHFRLDFAVCADVCVPESRQFSLTLTPGQRRDLPRLASLVAQLPREGQVADRLIWNEAGLQVFPAQPGDAVLAEGVEEGLVLSLPEKRAYGSYVFRVTSGQLAPGAEVRLTLLTGLGGLSEVRRLEAPAN